MRFFLFQRAENFLKYLVHDFCEPCRSSSVLSAVHTLLAAEATALIMEQRGYTCRQHSGIYDDPKLVSDLREACATVRKAIEKMCPVGRTPFEAGALALNQGIRWVAVKEDHCKVPQQMILVFSLSVACIYLCREHNGQKCNSSWGLIGHEYV